MLKKFYKKKIMISLSIMFAIGLTFLFPNTKEKLTYNQELNYVNLNLQTTSIYLNDSNNYLALTKILTNSNDTLEKAKEVLESLIIDGSKQDNIPSGFKAVIPSNTKILNINLNNETIKVDFSKELMETSLENEEKIIEAIVYSLTNLEDIKFVIIYMEGELLTKLPKSKINLPATLDRSFGINKEYNLNSNKDISKTTIYYISKFNDEEYYVPVTKINNDNRNKIEIIIDELSSTNLHKTNLMSYLNNNTKLISVNENENELVVNFNSAIFNDINTKEILEEVIYTISMSINDNYSVNSVVFNVFDEEIYKSVLKSIE